MLGADRKAITASLYACEKDGKVQNTAEDGKPPRWVALQEPPAEASSMEIPDRFGYKGDKPAPAGKPTPAAMPTPAAFQMAVKRPVPGAAGAPFPNMSGLTPKQQAALAKKGGGKGRVVAVAPAQQPSAAA